MTTPNPETIARAFHTMLHDLAQPMTSVRCMLDLAEMETEVEPMRASVTAALRECERMIVMMRSMRDLLLEPLPTQSTLPRPVTIPEGTVTPASMVAASMWAASHVGGHPDAAQPVRKSAPHRHPDRAA
jgi:hypothetical protein